MEEVDELPSAIQRDIASHSVVKTINDIDVKGKSQYEESIKARLTDCTTSIHTPLSATAFWYFGNPRKKSLALTIKK